MARRNPNHGLLPLRRVLSKIDNPQDHIPVVHIAGTNGKGSVSNDISEILQASGRKVGLFTSPHIAIHRDRMRIQGRCISQEQYLVYLEQFLPSILEENLGMFEITFLIAMQWFYDQKIDIAIVECGLGGRLDSTNVIASPVLTVLTTIGKDHTAILGERYEQIAFEKAGIMRPYTTCIVGKVPEKARKIIQKHGERLHSPIQYVENYRNTGKGIFIWEGDTYSLSMEAEYQKQNAIVALAAVRYLGVDIHSTITKNALAMAQWAGRFEKMRDHPAIYIDGAHNEAGMKALLQNYESLSHPIISVFSALRDKPGRKMAGMLKEKSDVLIVTSFESSRSDTIEDLTIQGAMPIEQWQEAVEIAIRKAEKCGTVVITGSLYFISEARKYFTKK